MPMVVFERTGFALDAPAGGALRELCDAHPRAAVPFSCRHANCGTCRIEVREGAELCTPPEADEQRLLTKLRAPPRLRLGCQLVLRAGDGRVRLWVTL